MANTSAPAKPAIVALIIPHDLADKIVAEVGTDTQASADVVLEALQEMYG